MDLRDYGYCEHNILDEPEHETLLRLGRLAEHLFHVPIAYVALLGPGLTTVTRIGSGREYWENLRTYPLAEALAEPQLWPGSPGPPVPGFDSGILRFAASAPLRSSDGLELGVLVIADVSPRPEFRENSLRTLEDLASVLAGKMELRQMACQARESERLLREAEGRFRSIANSMPVMLMYSGADAGSSFVNRAWLEFTGREFGDELGDGFADTFHPDHRERVVQVYWNAIEERRPFRVEFPMRRFDGEYQPVEARGMPRFLDDGSYAGYVACFIDRCLHQAQTNTRRSA